MVRVECNNSINSLECIFREDGVTVQLIREFFSIHAAPLVKKIVSKVISSVLAKPNLELELRREKVEEYLKEHYPEKSINEELINQTIKTRSRLLMKFVNNIIEKFEQAVSSMSQELKDFVRILRFNICQISPSFFYQLVGGMLKKNR